MKRLLAVPLVVFWTTAGAQTLSQNLQLNNARNSASTGFFTTLPPAEPAASQQVYLNENWKYASFRLKEAGPAETWRMLVKVNVDREEIELRLNDEIKLISFRRLADFTLYEEHNDRKLFPSHYLEGLYSPGIYEALARTGSNYLVKRYFTKRYPSDYIPAFDVGEQRELLKIKEEFILLWEGEAKVLPASRKKILATFPDPEKAKRCVKAHDLNLQKEADLVRLFVKVSE